MCGGAQTGLEAHRYVGVSSDLLSRPTMKYHIENDARASPLRRGTPLQAVRVAGWSVGAALALCAALLAVHGVAGTDPFVSMVAVASALWLGWFVFDYAMRPLENQPTPHPTHQPAPQATHQPVHEHFADTVADWQRQE
jgi:hypothetical protein